MLDRFVLLINFIAAGLVFVGALRIIKIKRAKKRPKGAVVIEKIQSSGTDESPGKRWSQLGVVLPIILNIIMEILVMMFCILDWWSPFAQLMAIDFPVWFNWIGMIGLWFCIPLDTANFYYNPNFRRLYKPLEGKYALATGGPYKYIRHPMYVGGMIEVIFFFITTGIYIIPIYLVYLLISLPVQAKGEEKLLTAIFGEIYTNYSKSTGRFLPKIKKTI